MKKYKLRLDLKLEVYSKTLYRIERLRDGKPTGDVGGYIESEANLSQDGTCWVYGDAWISSVNEIVNFIIAFSFSITITPDNIAIGCQLKKRSEWLKVSIDDAEKMGLPRELFPQYRKLVKIGMKLVPKRSSK